MQSVDFPSSLSFTSCFQASKKYLSVARQMKEYEDRKYEAWKEQVEANLLIYLKKNLLIKPSASSATTHRSAADEGNSEDASGSLAAAVQAQGNIVVFFFLIFFSCCRCLSM